MTVLKVLHKRLSKATLNIYNDNSDKFLDKKLHLESPTQNVYSQLKANNFCKTEPICCNHEFFNVKKNSTTPKSSSPFISYKTSSTPGTPMKLFSSKICISVDNIKSSKSNLEPSFNATFDSCSCNSNSSAMINPSSAKNSVSAPATLDLNYKRIKDETINFDAEIYKTNKFNCTKADHINKTFPSNSTSSFSLSCNGTSFTKKNIKSLAFCSCQKPSTTIKVNFSDNPSLHTKFLKKLNGISKQSLFVN